MTFRQQCLGAVAKTCTSAEALQKCVEICTGQVRLRAAELAQSRSRESAEEGKQ